MLVAIKYCAGSFIGEERMVIRTRCADEAIRRARARFCRNERHDAAVLGTEPAKVLGVRVVTDAERRAEWYLPEPPQYEVWIEVRGEHADDVHVDEFIVIADSPASAVEKAKAKWRRVIGEEYPEYRICEATVATPDRMERIG